MDRGRHGRAADRYPGKIELQHDLMETLRPTRKIQAALPVTQSSEDFYLMRADGRGLERLTMLAACHRAIPLTGTPLLNRVWSPDR